MIVNKFGLFSLTSRRNNLVKNANSLSIHSIKPIIKGKNGFSGGLEDIGNFAEGFCFKVVKSDDSAWIICVDNLKDKEEWM